MPKIVSDATRAAEAKAAADAIAKAMAANPQSAEDWAKVAECAGMLQRRARQLAGLGRGG